MTKENVWFWYKETLVEAYITTDVLGERIEWLKVDGEPSDDLFFEEIAVERWYADGCPA